MSLVDDMFTRASLALNVRDDEIATLRTRVAEVERERDDWMERVVNHAYEVQVTCFRGHTYQQEFGWCPRCGADTDERVATLEAALRDAATILDEYEGNPSLAVMLARAALSPTPEARTGGACAVTPMEREAQASIALDRDQTHYVGDACPGGHMDTPKEEP